MTDKEFRASAFKECEAIIASFMAVEWHRANDTGTDTYVAYTDVLTAIREWKVQT